VTRCSLRVLALLFLIGAVLLVTRRASADLPRTRRVAVIVGANEPAPGRLPLRYAQSDAQLMADVLVRVGRFAKTDVQTLLEPHPADILAALDRAAQELKASGPDSLLVFYYSGHSDGQQVFPHGEALSLTDLRDRIARSSARVRVAILDTCRGGGWTHTKGLTVGPPLDAVDLMNVATEGTALLSSSSGLENAHEAGSMKGSFFTHHVAAGLLGAADKSGDGNVTLQEVFEYAKERTVRDSARMAATTQHPSFDMQLRGRQDIVLAQMASSPSALEVSQTNAMEVIHLGSGVTVMETPPGRQQLRLALVPGRYVVRRVSDGRVYSKEVDVTPGATVMLTDAQLELTGSERLALKDASAPQQAYAAHTTLPRRTIESRIALGVSTGAARSFGPRLYETSSADGDRLKRSISGIASFTYGISDRLSWAMPVPAFAYRFGEEGFFEVVPRAGATALGYSSVEAFVGTLDAGVTTRAWLTPSLSLVSNAFADWNYSSSPFGEPGSRRGDFLDLGASLGLVRPLFEGRLTLAFGAGWVGAARLVPPPAERDPAQTVMTPAGSVVFGAVQTLGFRPLPLVSVQISRRLSLDAYASWSVDLRSADVRDRYLGGFTYAW